MRNLFLASAAVLAAASTPAFAQTVDDQPPTGEGFNQFYIGGSFGGAHTAQRGGTILFDRNLDGTFGDTITTAAGANAFAPGFCPGVATSSANQECRFQRDGIEYFARLGADTQRGRFVIGFVVEGGRPDFNESVSAFSSTPASYTLTRDVRWNLNARGRIGYTPNNRTLFYAAGGPSYARVRIRNATSNTVNSFTTNGSANDWGFNVGGGIEQKIGNNFSIGLEYLYTDLRADRGRVRVAGGAVGGPFTAGNAAGTDFRFSNQNLRWHSARITAAFRF